MPLLVEKGLPAEVWALKAVSGKLPYKMQTNAAAMLADLVGCPEEELGEAVELIDDSEWKEFPEIGKLVMAATKEETSLCLAIGVESGAWAIGIAGKTKVREPTAKLALAMALASEREGEELTELGKKWPDLVRICERAGALPEGSAPPATEAPAAKLPPAAALAAAASRRRPFAATVAADGEAPFDGDGADDAPASTSSKRRRRVRAGSPGRDASAEGAEGEDGDEEGDAAGGAEGDEEGGAAADGADEAEGEAPPATSSASAAAPEGRGLPRDSPFWINIGEAGQGAELPAVLEGLQPEALIMTTDGKKRPALYSRVDEALRTLLPALGIFEEDFETAVEYTDDPDLKLFPMIREQLQRIAPDAQPFTVATCPALGIWAAGASSKAKFRRAAAKVALAGTLGMMTVEADLLDNFDQVLPAYAALVDEVQKAKAAFDSEIPDQEA